eukprot:COSAG04_NODE_31_length_35649_cov_21.693052_2_plen_390_part_00
MAPLEPEPEPEPPEADRPPHWCEVCQLDLQSAASLAGHVAGRKHQRRCGRAPPRRELLPALAQEDFISAFGRGQYRRVVVLTGAGVSTAAGVPDFRSAGGLFGQIRERFGARWPELHAEPERLLSRAFATAHPEAWEAEVQPFLQSIKHPGAGPTATHHFCAWLHERGWLRRVYTQNVDGLHTDPSIGLPRERVCEVHGALRDSSIVLYGDPIPDRFGDCAAQDFPVGGQCGEAVDLVLVLGTSLQVAPFCALPNLAPRGSTRVLVSLKLADCLQNSWSLRVRTGAYGCNDRGSDHGLSQASQTDAGVNIGKHKNVPLRQMWRGERKAGRRWRQLLVEGDCDAFISRLRAAAEPSPKAEPEPEPELEAEAEPGPETEIEMETEKEPGPG